jgi:hypothetical protein
MTDFPFVQPVRGNWRPHAGGQISDSRGGVTANSPSHCAPDLLDVDMMDATLTPSRQGSIVMGYLTAHANGSASLHLGGPCADRDG